MEFYDAHIHFYSPDSGQNLKKTFGLLEGAGMIGFDALVFADFPPEWEKVLRMIPGAYHCYATVQALEAHRDPFSLFRLAENLKIQAFVDGRFIDRDMDDKVRGFRERGFKGLKLLYVPEEDPVNRIGGMAHAFGRSVRRSEEITARLIESASSQGMAIVLHADLKRYGPFISEMVGAHPQTFFNIPHFGSSRKAIARLVERYPNCYTDLSSLRPVMEGDPESYLDFVRQYQDKILFGSDALICQPDHVLAMADFVRRFLGDEELFDKLVNKNYLKFHNFS
jgi:hypothetical protein